MTDHSRPPSPLRVAADVTVFLSLAFAGMIAGGWWLTLALALPPPLPSPLERLGWILVVAALVSLAYCGRFLSLHGQGTPYPRLPPARLVTTGPYERVRNPIILSWGAVIIGLGLAIGLTGLLVLLVPTVILVHVYIVCHEEPLLVRRFGAEYEDYLRRVPRWIPRLRS